MPEKQIEEVMALVCCYGYELLHPDSEDADVMLGMIRDKLREAMDRPPVSDEQIREYVQYASISGRWAEPYAAGIKWGIRHYERLHGIGESPCEQPS